MENFTKVPQAIKIKTTKNEKLALLSNNDDYTIMRPEFRSPADK